jgi:hypothetical protein
MNNLYLPESTIFNKCYVVQNEDVIRAYDTIPSNNTSYNYRDYYINSNYIYKDGSGTWSQYSTLPICLSPEIITNDFYYRNDFADILIIFFIFSLFIVYIPFKIISRAFGRWLKL